MSSKLKSSYTSLSNRYRSSSHLSDMSHISRQTSMQIKSVDEVNAYHQARSPATSGVLKAIWPALEKRLDGQNIISACDIGCGTGAAQSVFSKLLPDLNWHLMDCNPLMRDKFNKIWSSTKLNYSWHNSIDSIPECDISILSYVMNETAPAEALAILKKTWECTKQMSIITLPGTPMDYKRLMELRSFLIENGAKIIAPCPHNLECPIMKNNPSSAVKDWCHFSCRIERSKTHKAIKGGTNSYEDEKYCYLIAEKTCDDHRKNNNNSRIIKRPISRKGHLILDTCTPTGLSERKCISAKNSDYYRYAKSLKWGDCLKTMEEDYAD